jgi:hypothetical protein
MVDRSSVLKQAVESLDECDFFGARTAYRQAALMAPPSESLLDNLALAEEGERLEYRCSLVEMYPESLDVLLDHVKCLLALRNYNAAVHRCAELLQRSVWSPVESVRIRELRMRAMVAGGSSAISSQSSLKEDLLFILKYHVDSPSRQECVSWLAKSVASVCKLAAVETLAETRDALCDEIRHEHLLKMIMTFKIRELGFLEELQRDEKGEQAETRAENGVGSHGGEKVS